MAGLPEGDPLNYRVPRRRSACFTLAASSPCSPFPRPLVVAIAEGAISTISQGTNLIPLNGFPSLNSSAIVAASYKHFWSSPRSVSSSSAHMAKETLGSSFLRSRASMRRDSKSFSSWGTAYEYWTSLCGFVISPLFDSSSSASMAKETLGSCFLRS